MAKHEAEIDSSRCSLPLLFVSCPSFSFISRCTWWLESPAPQGSRHARGKDKTADEDSP